MAALSTPAAPPFPQRASHPISHADPQERQQLLLRAEDCERQARRSADEGNIAAAARLILQGLDFERRAGGIGPQVLQLIKPR